MRRAVEADRGSAPGPDPAVERLRPLRRGARREGGSSAIAADDKKRKENEDETLRRKPDLVPIPQTELPRQLEVTLWDVLHTLARATAPSWRGAVRGLAEHWGALKYTQALAGGRNSFLGLTDEGHRIADHYKSLQSGELGIGFALTLTEHMLHSRFPDHSVTIGPADTTLRAG
ncbi:hypothetical protein E4N62_39690 [Streptomyces sp. MNU76]|uniref:hypothetical protein n=1 Tax=Streptomyces sp. MNU76 TaxID=2560026 RepID=UPI001E5A5FA2|nr:hypothetical protein [Streptomyces sp. MNU76]MCC9710823.1 hypothetical protein [Streptomyces sp. MNU76]